MSIEKTLSVKKREGLGKGSNRRLRTEGLVPGVFYAADGKNIAVQSETLPLEKIYAEMSTTGVFNLEIEGEGTFPAMFWQVQKHPYKRQFSHIDFFGVDLEKEIKVKVPVEFVGTSKGVKLGGRLETYREVLLLKAKPMDMPQKITVDISDMGINTTIMVADIVLPANVSAVYDRSFAMVSVLSKDKSLEEGASK